MLFASPAFFTVLLNRIKKPFTYGLTPAKLALSITTGILIGAFPFFIIPSFLVMFAALTRRVNIGITMVFNYAAWPLQIILFVPYTRFGNCMFGGSNKNVSFETLLHSFRIDFFGALQRLSSVIMHSIAGWGVSSVPAGLVLYFLLYVIAKAIVGAKSVQNL